jgi:RHS repeat-associated protein
VLRNGKLVKKSKPGGNYVLYIGGVMEVEKDSNHSVLHTTVYYPAGGAVRVDNTLSYVLGDQLGSASLTLSSAGAYVSSRRYYPFGELRYSDGTMPTDRLFTSQRAMEDLGIYFYNARFYSAALGRFLSADTVLPGAENSQSYDRYAYAQNSPIVYNDPSGHFWCLFATYLGNPCGSSSNSNNGPSAQNGGATEGEANASEGTSVTEQDGLTTEQSKTSDQNEEPNLTEETNNTHLHRPYVRNWLRQQIERTTEKAPDGRFIDPDTRAPMDPPYDLGHTYGHENWREIEKAEEEGLTQRQFNDRMNNPDYYRMQNRQDNRSHRFEMK